MTRVVLDTRQPSDHPAAGPTRDRWQDRYFYDSRGWYVRLRHEDADLLEKIRVKVAERTADALVVGPFPSKSSLQRWFGGFIELHGRNRWQHDTIPDDLLVRTYRPCKY